VKSLRREIEAMVTPEKPYDAAPDDPRVSGSGKVVGTWRLVEATAVDADGQGLPAPYGPIPMGRLVLTESGRMMAVICDGRNAVPEGEVRGYASYCGNYVIEDGMLITTVDAALVPERIGGQQRRRFAFRDDKLVLSPPARPNGESRELVWERAGDA
jgi:Lipocalin-like domain